MMRPSLTNLPIWLERIERAPLKPAQKLALIKTFVVPKLFHVLMNAATTVQLLRSADKMIKTAIKSTHHLNVHTPDAALYARLRDGGLGIPELASTIPHIRKKAIKDEGDSRRPCA